MEDGRIDDSYFGLRLGTALLGSQPKDGSQAWLGGKGAFNWGFGGLRILYYPEWRGFNGWAYVRDTLASVVPGLRVRIASQTKAIALPAASGPSGSDNLRHYPLPPPGGGLISLISEGASRPRVYAVP